MKRASGLLTVCAGVGIIVFALLPEARAQEKAPDVSAGTDGSCIYHKNVGGGTREEIHVANGATYHQEAVKGRKSGIVYVPDRTYLCKNGHFSKVD